MKANKALRRLTHVEELLSDVMERYSAGASDIGENLQSAKIAVTRAKEALKLQAPSRTTSGPKTAATKKAAVKVPPVRATKKQRTSKRDYEE